VTSRAVTAPVFPTTIGKETIPPGGTGFGTAVFWTASVTAPTAGVGVGVFVGVGVGGGGDPVGV